MVLLKQTLVLTCSLTGDHKLENNRKINFQGTLRYIVVWMTTADQQLHKLCHELSQCSRQEGVIGKILIFLSFP